MVHTTPEDSDNPTTITTTHSYQYSSEGNGAYDSVSMTGVVKVTKGSKVWVKVIVKDSEEAILQTDETGSYPATFTGVLVPMSNVVDIESWYQKWLEVQQLS